jgi:subtilisin family serine protease
MSAARLLTLLAALVSLILLASATAAQPSGPGPARAKLSPWLLDQLDRDGRAEALVVLRDQANLSGAARLAGKAARGRFAVERLRAVARRSQPPLLAELDWRGVAYRPFYLVNAVLVEGDAALLLDLAARPEVARLVGNPTVPGVEPPGPVPLQSQVPGSLPWGLARIGADQVWAEDLTGQGIVVASDDTGIQWNHPALIGRYRGWDGVRADHNYNWHDAIHRDIGTPNTNPCGYDAAAPCDDNGHGTHTVGTMVGDDGGDNHVGVAPGARWIGCRNMDNGDGNPASYIECLEFFVAPYPIGGDPLRDGDPARAPHVVNNSWYCPASEGCALDTLHDAVEAVRAAGIAFVTSAGNSGPGCGSVEYPPAIYPTAFSVAAFAEGDNIAAFSSRGPVTIDASRRPKPDVAAPGVGVYSAVPGGYGFKSGTSMASPHVAGLIALVWSAQPVLVGDVARTGQLIQDTAEPKRDGTCGGAADLQPNNTWGWGIVNAPAAVRAARALPVTPTPTPPLNYTLYLPLPVVVPSFDPTGP